MADSSRVQRIKGLLRDLHRAGVRDPDVLFTIAKVPRERFVPPEIRFAAWANRALPIGHGQTISQPLIVGLMTQALHLTGKERVLEIGTGSGYHTAILAELAGWVLSLEHHPALAKTAASHLQALGYTNVELIVADGTHGWEPAAPYDRIIVTAAATTVPEALLAQLAPTDGARLVIPVGPSEGQDLIVIERLAGRLVRHSLGPVSFVPLVSERASPPPTNGHARGD